ncbi:universal stress protein [Natronorarus salvus]|uniref:universal stress protein n=1 Tax=Natronorarus salvus TaxID=3117733 RepID=UPI002F26D8A8
MYDSVLVATDGSTDAERAVRQAVEIARRFEAELHALSVADERLARSAATEETYRQIANRAVRVAEREAAEAGVGVTTAVRTGAPAAEILDYASENGIDLLVVGNRGRSGLDRFFVGSVAERVVRRAESSVLVVRS